MTNKRSRGLFLNYSTTVAADVTANEIQRLLVQAGAEKLQLEYQNANLLGLSWLMRTPQGTLPFTLPVNVEATYKVLQNLYGEGKISRGFSSMEQARRTAWRQLKVWVEAQLALIQIGAVETAQVFLPYLRVNSKQTLFEVMKARSYMLALPEPSASTEKQDVEEGAFVDATPHSV